MNLVVYEPSRKCSCVINCSRKRRFVLTPRTRNSFSARSMRAIVSSDDGAQAVTFTSSESYERVMNAPEYAVPASSRMPKPAGLR